MTLNRWDTIFCFVCCHRRLFKMKSWLIHNFASRDHQKSYHRARRMSVWLFQIQACMLLDVDHTLSSLIRELCSPSRKYPLATQGVVGVSMCIQ